MKKQVAGLLLCGAIFSVVGCDNSEVKDKAAVTPSVLGEQAMSGTQYTAKALTRGAWLRERLPESVFLYGRIPSLWALASYKEDSFKYAMGNDAYLTEIKKIQEASAQWFKQADPEVTTLLMLLGSQMDGPVEVAAYTVSNQPQLLLSANVRFNEASELQGLIDLLKDKQIIRQVLEPMVEGAGVVMTEALPLAYRWDKANGRLNLMLNMQGADIAELDAAYASLVNNPQSPMLSNESLMDDSQQGLYVWFDNQKAASVYSTMLPPDVAMPMAAMGVPQMKTLAASWGVSNGKGRFKVQLDAPSTGMVRQFLPVSHNSYPIKTAGKPSLMLSVSLPSFDDFRRLEMMAGGLQNQDYQDAKVTISEVLGYTVDDWFKAVGPEVVVISDDAGEYLAVRLRDPEQFKSIMTATQKMENVLYESRQVNGHEIVHLKLPGMASSAELDQEDPEISPMLVDLLTRVGTHLYWQREGDFLILTDLPQVLLDRQALLSDVTLQHWLEKDQRQDITASTLAFSGNIQDAPRRIYYMYLNGIQALGDLTGANQDLYHLPTARQLGMPEQGTYGFQLDSSDDKLSMELVFESTPADMLLAGDGPVMIASIGILAAIAIPAYQDYTLRAEVAGAYMESHTLRTEIEMFYRAEGRYPNESEAPEFFQEEGQRFYLMELEPDTGTIYMELKSGDQGDLDGSVLTLEPDVFEHRAEWSCGGDVSRKYLPSGCK
jgi:hypothetical protein